MKEASTAVERPSAGLGERRGLPCAGEQRGSAMATLASWRSRLWGSGAGCQAARSACSAAVLRTAYKVQSGARFRRRAGWIRARGGPRGLRRLGTLVRGCHGQGRVKRVGSKSEGLQRVSLS
jgi:hypothetical protein